MCAQLQPGNGKGKEDSVSFIGMGLCFLLHDHGHDMNTGKK